MKKNVILHFLLALIFSVLACQTVTGGGDIAPASESSIEAEDGNEAIEEESTLPPVLEDTTDAEEVVSEFPIPDGAINVINLDGVINFQVEMSLADGMDYYRREFTQSGYVEREILTVTSDIIFNLVFDGHPSGKAIMIQGVDMGDGTINISLRLEEI